MTVGFWGLTSVITLAQNIKSFCAGVAPHKITLVTLITAIATITATLIGGKMRTIVGYLWIAVSMIAAFVLATSAFLGMRWLLINSLCLLLVSLVSVGLIFQGYKR